jgi:replicative DNA helicase
MSSELGLLHRLITDNAPLSSLARLCISDEHLSDEGRAVLGVIQQHRRSYGSYPSLTVLQELSGVSFPRFPREPLEFWAAQVLDLAIQRVLSGTAREVRAALRSDNLTNAETALLEAGRTIQRYRRGEHERVFSALDLRAGILEAHDRRARTAGLSGVPTGFQTLDELSDGVQSGDTLALVGRTGMGKSYVLLQMAMTAFLSMYTPMFVSYEMDEKQIARRLFALASGVSNTALRKGEVSFWGRRHFVDATTQIFGEDARPFHIVKGAFTSTIESLYFLVQEYGPSALYVDGAYLVKTKERTNSRTERIAFVAEELKVLAQALGIPVLATYQFNRMVSAHTRGGTEHIGGSDAIGQLASIALSLSLPGDEKDRKRRRDEEELSDEEKEALKNTRVLHSMKGREGENFTINLRFDMDKMRIYELAGSMGEGDDDN